LVKVIALGRARALQETVDLVLHITSRVRDVGHFAATTWQFALRRCVVKRDS
jgi:hypothetical protein